jgi:carboxyl-terminal processing protease
LSSHRFPPHEDGHTSTADSGQALFVLGLVLGLLAALAIERAARAYFDDDVELVRTVRDIALEDFVRPVDGDVLVEDALNGMLGGLDRYSHYYGPPEVAALERETSGEFLGIGVVFRPGELGRILFPYPGSPAEAAGLRVGDLIVAADGRAIAGMPPRELGGLLHQEDSEVRLAVQGLAGEEREVLLRPDVVLDPTVRHVRMLDGGIGYLSIRSFSHRTPEEFDRALEELDAQGLTSLVLDLRANPGGILDAAISIANRFVSSGALLATRAREETSVTTADPERATRAGLPLVVLLDARSASASEVLAAALQDHAVAALVGEPTYGKGTVQTLKHVGRERAIVKITTASYLSPSMRRIEHAGNEDVANGIAPDLWVPIPAAERNELHRFLDGYSPPASALAPLREWEQREGRELIATPPADRQLEAAVALLSEGSLELRGDPLE